MNRIKANDAMHRSVRDAVYWSLFKGLGTDAHRSVETAVFQAVFKAVDATVCKALR